MQSTVTGESGKWERPSQDQATNTFFVYCIKTDLNTRFFPCPICVHSRLRRNFQARWASWTTFWKKIPNLPVQDSRKCELTASGRLPHFHHDLLAFIDIECKVSPPQDFLCHWMSNLSGFFGGNLNRTCQSSCLGWVTPSRSYTAYGRGGLL